MNQTNRKNSFSRRVYDCVKRIPRGKVSTYGRIAEECGCPRAARAVGTVLHMNPQPGEIPCHRVVNRDGRLAPAFAFGGAEIQKSLLEAEGVKVSADGYVDLAEHLAPNDLSDNDSHNA